MLKSSKRIPLGSIGGVPIALTAGWVVIALVMMIVFAPIVGARLDLELPAAIPVAFAVPVLLALSVLVHELAHGISAQRLGYRVREYVITLWGGHTTFSSDIDRPGAAAVVSAAGPSANLLLAALGWWVTPLLGPIAGFLAVTLSLTNFFVGVFNLLPASPLDGGKLLEALIWKVTGNRWVGMRIAGRLGQVTAVLVVAGFVIWPYYTGAAATFTVITGIIVGGVIWQGAKQTVKVATYRQASESFSLDPYLVDAAVVRSSDPVSSIVALPAIVVDEENNLAIVDPRAYAAVPAQDRRQVQASSVQARTEVAIIRERHGSAAMTQVARSLNAGAKVLLLSEEGTHLPNERRLYVIDIERVLVELRSRTT